MVLHLIVKNKFNNSVNVLKENYIWIWQWMLDDVFTGYNNILISIV